MPQSPTTGQPEPPGTDVITRTTGNLAHATTGATRHDAATDRSTHAGTDPSTHTGTEEPLEPASGAGTGQEDNRAWHAGSGWHGEADWGGGGAPPPQPPDPAQPAPAPLPPVLGPGSRATSLVLALCLLTVAALALAHHQGVLDANVWLVAGGAVLVLLGAGVLVSGMRGRSQGGLGVLALLVALLMVPAAAASAALPGFSRVGTTATTFAGDPTWVPTTAAMAREGYSLVAGELVVDLTELDEDARILASVTFGNLHVVVPDDMEVTVNARVGAGEVAGRIGEDWAVPGALGESSRREQALTNGVGITTTLSTDGSPGAPAIAIDAEVTFGRIIIEETS